MELWVRNQAKNRFVRVSDIYCCASSIESNGGLLGDYATEERCLEIIDEIQKLLLRANGDYLIKLQDIDVNGEVETIFGMEKLQNNRITQIADEPSVSVIQPCVLVYEMPKE